MHQSGIISYDETIIIILYSLAGAVPHATADRLSRAYDVTDVALLQGTCPTRWRRQIFSPHV